VDDSGRAVVVDFDVAVARVDAIEDCWGVAEAAVLMGDQTQPKTIGLNR
jgi:hypothetical protein